jgi:hypothetical protein
VTRTMSALRLRTVAPDLVEVFETSSPSELLEISSQVVSWVFSSVDVPDPRARAGKAGLVMEGLQDPAVRFEVGKLMEELDHTAWELQDDEAATPGAYLDAFARARAANSLWYALAGPELEMTMECAYEAQAAHGDVEGLREVVTAVKPRDVMSPG